MDLWMDRWMDRRMDGSTDGWMDGLTYVCDRSDCRRMFAVGSVELSSHNRTVIAFHSSSARQPCELACLRDIRPFPSTRITLYGQRFGPGGASGADSPPD